MSADDHRGMAEVRASTHIRIAAGESEFTRFDFRDLIEHRAVDVLQPDLRSAAGRPRAAASPHSRRLTSSSWRPIAGAPALSFQAGISLAFASPACRHHRVLARRQPAAARPCRGAHRRQGWSGGRTQRPGFGATPRPEFIDEFTVPRK